MKKKIKSFTFLFYLDFSEKTKKKFLFGIGLKCGISKLMFVFDLLKSFSAKLIISENKWLLFDLCALDSIVGSCSLFVLFFPIEFSCYLS
jgi:hypothetical protein